MTAPAPYTPVARIVKTHGLKGEVVAVPADGLPFLVSVSQKVRFVPPRAGIGECTVVEVRPTPKGSILKLAEIDTIALSQSLVGTTLLLRTEDVPEIPVEEDDELEEFIGSRVVDEVHGDLGTISEIILTGANDVWVLSGGPFGEVLIPVIDQVVLGWEDESRTVIAVRLLEGLLPDESEEV